MRLAIADDEPLLRYHLRSLIAEIDPALSISEFDNGRDLVAAVSRGDIDAAFVDIRMPKLDGLGAMRELAHSGHVPPWVILSSYSEFDYAKRAIDFGALGYALKPPSPEEVALLLAKLRTAVSRARLERSVGFEHAWAAAVRRSAEQEASTEAGAAALGAGSATAEIGVGPAALFVPCAIAVDDPIWLNSATATGIIQRLIADRADRQDRGGLRASAVADRRAGVFDAACVLDDPTPVRNEASAANRFWTESGAALAAALAELRSSLAAGPVGQVRLMAGDCARDLQAAADQLPALRDGLNLRPLLPSGFIERRCLGDLLRTFGPADVKSARAACRVAEAAYARDRAAFRAATTDLHAILAEADRTVFGRIDRFLVRSLGLEPGAGGDPTDGLRKRLVDLENRLSAVDELNPTRQPDLVAAIREYTERHIAEPSTLAETAKIFGLTPNYLSTIFHQRTGATFMEFLTELRLNRARELLRRGLSVKECARSVGYKGERHFAQLFRRRFGVPPAAEKR